MDTENHEKYPSLTWPLISTSNCENGIDAGNERKCCENGFTWTTKFISVVDEDEVRKQFLLAVPLIASSLLQTYIQLISLMFVSRFGDSFLSAASTANFFVSTTLFMFLAGMASALYTLCGQSYGAKQYHMLGIHTQRAMFVLLLLTIPLAFIVSNTTSILISVGKNADIAVEAGQYAHFLIPGVFGYAILSCLKIFLQTQNLVFPMLLASGVTTLVHILLCWVLVSKSQLGYKGAALANSISYWINVMLLALYVKFSSSCMKTWTGFSKKALYNIITFLGLAIPSAFMACLMIWSFEAIFLLSGLLPSSRFELRVLAVSLQTVSLAWTFHEGLSDAVSIRVANELGARNPKAANLAVRIVLVIAIIECTFQGLVLMLIRNQWGNSYSNEIEVVKYVANFMPILAATNFLGRLQCVFAGIVRGCGGQKIVACINFGSYYIVGIPLAILLAFFFNMGEEGLWLGIITGLLVQVSFLVTITISINWELEANKAKERVCEGL